MDCEIKILGAPCGRHGPYTFHKAFSTTMLVRTNDDERTSAATNEPQQQQSVNFSNNVVNSKEICNDRTSTTTTTTTNIVDDGSVKVSGSSSDSYVFRKQTRVVAISDFCVVRPWSDSALLCVAELQLLWTEHRSAGVAGGDRTLASLRLYVEPASAPELNSLAVFGEDEVLAISEKVVLRLEDLVTWMTAAEEVPWTRGLQAVWYRHGLGGHPRLLLNNKDNNNECISKTEIKENTENGGVICDQKMEVDDKIGLDTGLEFASVKSEFPRDDFGVDIAKRNESTRYVEKIDRMRIENEYVKTKLEVMYEVKDFKEFNGKRNVMLSHSKLELADVDKEKENLAEPQETSTNCTTASSRVVVLSYSRYCRHRALAKRLEPSKKSQSDAKLEKVCTKMENIKIETSSSDSTNLQSTAKQISNSQLKQEERSDQDDGDDKSKIVKTESEDEKSVEDVNKALAESLLMSPEMQDALIQALGGYVADDRNTKILFCRETFSYPDLETHEMLCNHLAPKLKGRPRGRRKKQILPVYNSTKKRQLLSVNSDKNKGRKGHQDDDDERRMLQMLAGLSDSGGEMSGPDGAGDSDDMGSEHMPCAATVARMTSGGGRRGLRCNSRKPVKNNAVITPTGSRKRKQSDNSYIDNLNNTDDEDSNSSELSPELEQKARENFEQRLRDFNRDAMMDGYSNEKHINSSGGLQGVTNNTTGTKMTALMGDGKKLDMYMFYSSVQKLGGYDSVTASRQWRGIFEDLVARQENKTTNDDANKPPEGSIDAGDDNKSNGDSICDDKKINDDDKIASVAEVQETKSSPAPNAASATVTRRHYEKSLLAFERFEQANSSSVMSRQVESCRDPLAFDQKDLPSNNETKTAKQKLPKKPQASVKSTKEVKTTSTAKKKCKSTSDAGKVENKAPNTSSNTNLSSVEKIMEKSDVVKEVVVQPTSVPTLSHQPITTSASPNLPTVPPPAPTTTQQPTNHQFTLTTSLNIPQPTVQHTQQTQNYPQNNFNPSNPNNPTNPVPAVQPIMAQFNNANKFYPIVSSTPNVMSTPNRTQTSSSLRSVRVKQQKQGQNACGSSPLSNSASPGRNNQSPPVKDKAAAVGAVLVAAGAGNQNPLPAQAAPLPGDSDDNDVIEVAYKPATPEVIDLIDDDDDQQSNHPTNNQQHQPAFVPQMHQNKATVNPNGHKFTTTTPSPKVFTNPSITKPGKYIDLPSAYAAKRSKLEMLQQAGLEVTPVRQHIMMQNQQQNQQLAPPIPFNTQQFGFRSPAQQKTVYGNPRDILMPQQMLMTRFGNGKVVNNSAPICLSVRGNGQGAVVPQDLTVTPQSALDLSVKQEALPIKPGGNLEITLVAKQNQLGRPPVGNKRTSNGKFVKAQQTPKTCASDLVIPRYQPQQQPRREVALDRSNSVSISLEKPRQPIASKPVANVPPYFVEPPHPKQLVDTNSMPQLSHNETKNSLPPPAPANPGTYLQYLDPVFLSALCAATAQQHQNNHQQQQQQQQQQVNQQLNHQQQQAMLAAMLAAGLPITPATHEAMQLYGLLGLRLPSQQHK